MKEFKILVDVNSDLSAELRKRFDIEYLKAHITIPGGIERDGVLEWDFTNEGDFYSSLKKNGKEYTTAPASPEEYKEAYLKYLKNGFDVLSLSISSKLSGTYDFAKMGRDLALEEYKDGKIICVDSKKYSNGLGLLAILASEKRKEGMTIEEVAKWLEDNTSTIHQMGWLDDLSFVASKGRISSSQAFFGQLIGVKPLADFSKDGLVTVLGKAKGEKKAFRAIMEYMRRTIVNPEEQIILMAETNRKEKTLEFKKMIEDEFHPKEIIVNTVYPSCGINVGPGLMAAYYVGKPVSDELKEETKLLEEILNK